MSLNLLLYQMAGAADRLLSGVQVGIRERPGSLVTLFLHSLFIDEEEMDSEMVNPQEAMTVDKFAAAIEYFLKNGYRIVSINGVAQGLNAAQKSLLLTFDDGYFNNHRALPVLQEFKATAAIFLSANHVREGRPYWWDVLYRGRREQGRSVEEITRECYLLNTQKTHAIEEAVRAAAPHVPMQTVADLDRPLRPEEVRELAGSGRFFFENHTANHAVLSAYSAEEVYREISEAQASIEEMAGRKPVAIAYPNGAFTDVVKGKARQAGLSLAFATTPRKEYANDLGDRMALGRFQIFGNRPIESQCRWFRSDLMLRQRLRELKRRL